MSSDLLRVVDPKGYFAKYLEEGINPDGSYCDNFQPMRFMQGKSSGCGSSLVRSGGVTVSTSINASVAYESDGQLVNVEVVQSSLLTETETNEVKDILEQLFEKELFFPRNSVKARNSSGEELPLEWILNIEVKILNADGCVLDAVVFSVVSALRNTELPILELNHEADDESPIERDQIIVKEQKMDLKDIKYLLMCSTFGFFQKTGNDKEIMVVSPSTELQEHCTSVWSIIVGHENSIVFSKVRGTLKTIGHYKELAEIARHRRESFMRDYKL